MYHLSIDIETRSSVEIGKAGLYKYAQSPDFEILLFAYQLDGERVEVVDLKQGEQIPPLSCVPSRIPASLSTLTTQRLNGTA